MEAGPCKKAKLMIEYSDSDEDDEEEDEDAKENEDACGGENADRSLRLPDNGKQQNFSLEKENLHENEQLRPPESEERNDSSLNKESDENNPNSLVKVKQDEKMSVVKMTQKDEGLPNDGEAFVGEKMQNTNSEKESSGTSSGDLERSNEVEQKLDILQMYEQDMSSVLSKEDEREMNDEDTRATDDSSSEEEDVENDDISTEFVAVSEIDFNLYP